MMMKPKPGMAFPTSKVIVFNVQLRKYEELLESIGTAQANESVNLSPSVTETISKINFNEGDFVQKEYVLVELTSDEEKATLDEAKKQYERVENLTQNAAATLTRRDQQLLSKQVAEARLADRIIKAPFSGVLGLRKVSEGALVTPGMIITTLDDLSVIKLDFAVPETHLESVSPKKKIVATSVAFVGKTFEGTVYVVDTRVDPVTRTVDARALIPNPDRLLKPGILLDVKLVIDEGEAIIIPEEALTLAKEGSYVFVVKEDNTLTKRTVVTGRRFAGTVEVKSGIQVGEKIVMEGNPRLYEGQKVEVTGAKTIEQSADEFKKYSKE